MAEILIFTDDRTAEWGSHVLARGDIIRVEDDGFTWGNMETKANALASGRPWHDRFGLIKVPGLDTTKARKLLGADVDDTDPENPIVIYEHKWGLDLDAVQSSYPAKYTDFINDGEIEITLTQAKALAKHKRLDASFDPDAVDGIQV